MVQRNGNGRIDFVAKVFLGLIGIALAGILSWFGSTVHETAREVSSLEATAMARIGEIGRDLEEIRKIVDENRRTLVTRTGTLADLERRIDHIERRCCDFGPL